MKRYGLTICLFIFFTGQAQAFTDGSVIKLSEIVLMLKQEYKAILDQLKEAKAANDSMRQIYAISGEMYDEYRFIENFSSDAEIRRITRDIKGLTGLTGLNEADGEGRFRILRNEINRRFKNEDATRSELLNQVSELERLEALKQKKLEEAAEAGAGNMNDKNLNSSIASSNALISAMQIAEQQRKLQEEMRRREMGNSAKAYEDGFIEFLDQQK